MKIYWIICIWLILLYLSVKIRIGEIFCIISGIVLIFFNLGERKGASAYSVFNEGCAKLAGEFDPASMTKTQSLNKDSTNLASPNYIVKNHKLANKPCPCGSGKKHKKCCLHAKEIIEDIY